MSSKVAARLAAQLDTFGKTIQQINVALCVLAKTMEQVQLDINELRNNDLFVIEDDEGTTTEL